MGAGAHQKRKGKATQIAHPELGGFPSERVKQIITEPTTRPKAERHHSVFEAIPAVIIRRCYYYNKYDIEKPDYLSSHN